MPRDYFDVAFEELADRVEQPRYPLRYELGVWLPDAVSDLTPTKRNQETRAPGIQGIEFQATLSATVVKFSRSVGRWEGLSFTPS